MDKGYNAGMERGKLNGSLMSPAMEDDSPHRRCILHFDIDYFYAQVEEVLNPSLRERPLAIQQKYLLVTCNYVARNRGVRKLQSLKEAKERYW